jgi:putative ABC transport system permease protein
VLRATIKSLFARKLRLVLTALAVVLGVGMTAGSFILTDTALKSFDNLFGDVYKGTDVVVQGTTAFESSGQNNTGGGSERKPIPASVLPKVEAVDGVATAEGSIGGTAWIVDPATNKVIQNGGAPPIGGSWDAAITTLQIDPGGSPPTGPDQVVIDAATATDHGIAVGQQVKIVTTTGPGEFTVSGVARFGSSNSLLGATLALFDLPTAQKLFDRVGEYDTIYVKGDGVDPSQLAARVASVLPKGYESITAASAASQQQDQVSTGLGFLRTFFLIFGFVALFVGAFIIFNMFNIVVSQRTRELALFRALGANRRQVRTSVLLESIAVGLIGSILGIGLGVLLAFALKALLGALGLKLPPTALSIETRTIVVSLIVGIGVTVAAAWVPSRRASRVAPIEALRESSTPDSSIRRRAIIGGIVLILGIAAISAALFGGAANPGALVGLGAALTFLGVATLSPLFARGLAAVIGRPFRRTATGRLGDENAKRSPRRTASTASALMIGLGLVAFVSVFAASLKASAVKTLDDVLRADLTLSSNQFNPFSTHLAEQLRQDPNFSVVSELRQTEAHVGPSNTDAFPVAIDPATFAQVADITMTAGSLADLSQPGAVLVSKSKADGAGLSVGSPLQMTFSATGAQPAHVVGIFEDNVILSDYVISIATYNANVEQPLDQNVFLKIAPGVSPTDAKTQLDALLQKDYPNVQANDQEQSKQQFLDSINQLLAFVFVLLFLSIIISGFGILATLWLSVFERVRELGLLRAVGMARIQVKRMVRIEAVIVSVLGAILGLVIGILFAWALQRSLSDLGITELSLPVGQLIFLMILAALIGVVAAILPARRAAKLNVLEAISYE